jgi:two-component sensor histidine kinase
MDTPTATSGRIQEANHRIANHLSLLVGMVRLQMSHLEKGPDAINRDQVHSLLRETAGRILSVGHLHRRLSSQPAHDDIDLGDYLVESCQSMIAALSLGRIVFSGKFDRDCFVSAARAQAVALIANEIMLNAVKHAHPTGIAVQISLSCEKAKDGSVIVEISDDGVGLPEGFDSSKKRGYGFTVIYSLAQTADAALDMQSSDLGLSFRLRLAPSDN